MFRADLLDRLSFEVITLPPLRSRQGDVPLLAEHFGRRMAVELDWANWPGFTPRALAELEAYPWPGNVRELRNAVERAVYRHEDPERPIDAIQFDPFHSPWAPAGATVRAPEPVPHSGEEACGTATFGRAAGRDQRLPRRRFRPMSATCSRTRCARNRFNQRATAIALGPQLRPAAPCLEAPQTPGFGGLEAEPFVETGLKRP